MTGFKDQVAQDILGVFLSTDFFGEMYRIEGREIPVSVDNDELKERQGGQDLAVAESTLLLYARVSDLPRRRAAGSSLNVNGREYVVDDWTEDMGVATIVLHESIVA